MSNLENMKDIIIKKINSFNEQQLYEFLGEIECIRKELEVQKLFPEDLFWCNDCRRKYGDCEDDNEEADPSICEQRFIRFCKEELKE